MPRPMSNATTPALRTRARPAQGFWRCGVHHGPEWTEFPAGTFTTEQLEALEAESMLQVDVPPAAKPGAKPKKTKK